MLLNFDNIKGERLVKTMAFNIGVLNLPILRLGFEGSYVSAWQSFLKNEGYPIEVVDGDFGQLTDKATRIYQQKNNLDVDGVVGNGSYTQAAKQGFIEKGFIQQVPNIQGNQLLNYLGFEETQVKNLQASLNQVARLTPALVVDGDFGPRSSKGLAEAYLKRDIRLKGELEAVINDATKQSLGEHFSRSMQIFDKYARVLRLRLSGPHWIKSFPTSRAIADLKSPFRQRVQRFEKALIDAGCQVIVTATHRPRERAHLMHYASRIARRNIYPRYVPGLKGVNIDWEHYTRAGSIRGAQDMVDAYGIGNNPVSLRSRHIQRLAIDWIITWEGTIKIKDTRGRVITVGAPTDASANQTMWRVGASYGVYKLAGDPPHWSIDGA